MCKSKHKADFKKQRYFKAVFFVYSSINEIKGSDFDAGGFVTLVDLYVQFVNIWSFFYHNTDVLVD